MSDEFLQEAIAKVRREKNKQISQLQTEIEGLKMRLNNMSFELKRFPEDRIKVSVILEMLEIVKSPK